MWDKKKTANLLCPVDPSVVDESVFWGLGLVEVFGPRLALDDDTGLPVGVGGGLLEGLEGIWSPVAAEWSHSFGWMSLRVSMGLLST